MASKRQQAQRLIRHYREITGIAEVDMGEVVDLALKQGWPLPPPQDPRERLKQYFSQAAREEVRHDAVTGRPYRANHAIPYKQGQLSLYRWIDIDEAPRIRMLKAVVMRREQMLDDGVQLTLDESHWNRIHPEEEPIQVPMDFADDIEWRLNAPDEREEAA